MSKQYSQTIKSRAQEFHARMKFTLLKKNYYHRRLD
jgi:hypothetical protein